MIIKSLLLIISSIAALVITGIRTAPIHTHIASAAGSSGSLLTVGHNTAILRTGAGSLLQIDVTPATQFSTADGHSLSASSIRSGDHVTVTASHTVRDDSQSERALRGLIAVGPVAADDPLVIQVHPGWTIVADMTSSTHYSDATDVTSSPAQLTDADQITIQGIYDTTLGEMTQTASITRLGPVRKGTNA